MKKPYNVPLRVKHYNNKFKIKEAIIFLQKDSSDPNEVTNYTSLLYQKYILLGGMLEKEGAMYRFHYKAGGIGGFNIKALNFLQMLAYLEYYENWRQERVKSINTLLLKIQKEDKANKLAKEKEENKGIELEEKDGVTFIKNTNFVLSKFL